MSNLQERDRKVVPHEDEPAEAEGEETCTCPNWPHEVDENCVANAAPKQKAVERLGDDLEDIREWLRSLPVVKKALDRLRTQEAEPVTWDALMKHRHERPDGSGECDYLGGESRIAFCNKCGWSKSLPVGQPQRGESDE